MNDQYLTNQDINAPHIKYQYAKSFQANISHTQNEFIGQKSDIPHESMKSDPIKTITQESLIDPDDLRKTLLVLRAANHTLRNKILEMLSQKHSMTVTEICLNLRVPQSVTSKHLAILRKARVVVSQKRGKYVSYSLNEERISYISALTASMAH